MWYAAALPITIIYTHPGTELVSCFFSFITRKLSGEPFPWGGKVQHPRVSEGRHVEVEASRGSAGPSGPTCLGQRCQYHLGS